MSTGEEVGTPDLISDIGTNLPSTTSRFGRMFRPSMVAGVGLLGVLLLVGKDRRAFEGMTYDALKDPSRWEYAQTHYKPPRTWEQDRAKTYTTNFARDWYARYPEYPLTSVAVRQSLGPTYVVRSRKGPRKKRWRSNKTIGTQIWFIELDGKIIHDNLKTSVIARELAKNLNKGRKQRDYVVPHSTQQFHRGWKLAHRKSPPLTHTVEPKPVRTRYQDVLLAREIDAVRKSGRAPTMTEFAQNPAFNPKSPRRRKEERTGIATGGRGGSKGGSVEMRERRPNFNWRAAFEYMYPHVSYQSNLWNTIIVAVNDVYKEPEEIGDSAWLDNSLLFQSNILDLYGAQEGKCALTGLSFDVDHKYSAISVDRIIPRMLGGLYEPNNMRVVLRNLNLGLGAWEDEAVAYIKPNGLSDVNLEKFIIPSGEEVTLLIPNIEQRKLYIEKYGFEYHGGATPRKYRPPIFTHPHMRHTGDWTKYLRENYPEAEYSPALGRKINDLVNKKTNPAHIESSKKWYKENLNRIIADPVVYQDWKDNPSKMRNYMVDLYGRQKGVCAVTGIPFTYASVSVESENVTRAPYLAYPQTQGYAVPSIDQIIPDSVEGSPGYAPGNVRLVLLIVNKALRNYGDVSVAYLKCNGLGENNLKTFTIPTGEELTLMIPSQEQENIYTDPSGDYKFVEVTS